MFSALSKVLGRPSISRRLAVMFALMALAIFTLVGGGLMMSLGSQLEISTRQALANQLEVATLTLYHTSTRERWLVARDRLAAMSPDDPTGNHESTHFAVTSADPQYRFNTPITGHVLRTWPAGYQRMAVPGGPNKLVQTVEVPARGQRPALQLQVAVSYAQKARIMDAFGASLRVLYGLGTLIVLVLGYTVARIGLAPLARLTREASTISPHTRSQRLQTAPLPAELSELATSFNGALERLDVSHGRLEAFNADVAHELRTPITILIGQTEVALTRSRSADHLAATLESNLEELSRIRDIVNTMLFLARADQGDRATSLTSVSLAAECRRTLSFLEMTLEDAQMTVALDGDAIASVDTAMFGRALVNLLMNAIQHSTAGETISVSVTAADVDDAAAAHVVVAVANRGAPIPSTTIVHLFDRFYRAEASRTNSRENHGLGLAIVKAVAEMHGGQAWAASRAGVNTFAFSVAMQESNVVG
ncbi:heavy metal sensor histidine kinase [Robbsia sp. KACC 23696]|uniref:heavy metal sensor histidine kinase n=1 Tax=Robbsia sp. KACC 23696 TaxID=3149231 RepID=UPI00325BCD03